MRGSRRRGSPGVFVSERQHPRRGAEMVVRRMGYALDMRPLRVPVPAFPESDLPGVYSRTESRTVYL
jgi:hypothetical protein